MRISVAAQVGHTGDLKAAVRACTTVDKCLGELLETGARSRRRHSLHGMLPGPSRRKGSRITCSGTVFSKSERLGN